MILITENKDSALFFPEITAGIVIEGNGNAVTRLARIPWIVACPRIFYWGDLDAHGLAILDRLRSTGIDAESILRTMPSSTATRPTPRQPSPTAAPSPTGCSSAHAVPDRRRTKPP